MGDLLERLRAALAGRYAVEAEAGHGGMAAVFLAEDLKHRRQVAIKVLDPELAASLGGERFLREIEIAAQLQHPHILPLYDSGEAPGLLYYVMPFVEGESLRDRLTREGQLPLADALQIAREVADALSYAHSRGVVHRDIKPENVMLSGGHAVVADFGIARAVSVAGGEHLTRTGAAIGTPAYMSPEQAMGQPVDARGDQYSLACTLYEMLIGQPPFTGPTPQAIMARHSLEAVPSLQVVRNSIPDDVEDTIIRAMGKVPADRFPTVAQFAEALAAASPVATGRHTAARTRVRGPATHRWAAMLAATAVVALAAVAAWQLWRQPTAPASALGAAGGLDPHDVAVLYFDDHSGGELTAVADGLTEALIDQLGTVQTLRIISANGVRPYRVTSLPRDSIARALEVGTLITGSVAREGDRLRVAVHLVDHEGIELERESFAAPADSVLAIRDSLAAEATRLLRPLLGEEIKRHELRAGTANDAAWLLVQRAEKLRNDADHQLHEDAPAAATTSFERADSLLAHAEQLDPAWAEPAVRRARLAYTRARLAAGDPAAERHVSTGLGHAERALARDGNRADALEVRGSLRYLAVLLGLEHDHAAADRMLEAAEGDFRDATVARPSQARAWAFLAHLNYAKHDLLGASLAARRAYDLDAYLSGVDGTLWLLYTTSYDLDQHNRAADWCDELRRRFPDDPRAAECRLWLMTTRARDADVPLAWQLADRLVAATPAHDQEFARLNSRIAVAGVLARAALGDSSARVQLADSAVRLLRSTEGHGDVDPGGDLLVRQAFVYTLLNDRDSALRLLTQYVNAHREYREGFGKDVHWWWRSLQDDQRFRSLMGTGN